MQNDEKRIMELYIPRKCSATNRLIGPKDHASVQIEIATVSTLSTLFLLLPLRIYDRVAHAHHRC